MRDIKEIARIIDLKGGKLFLVGGAVRDKLLGIENHDEDYCVTGISSDEFKKLFPEAIVRGKDFPVFDIDGKEFAIARKERKIGIGHNSFNVETDKKITIEEDLERRDITINAIAQNVLTGEIIDPFNGQKDIENRIIRAVGSHFKEDPLRVYRVARFASKFDFKVDQKTIKMMTLLRDELSSLSAERVYIELKKALLSDYPSNFFKILNDARVLDIHFKEIYDLIGAEQPAVYHPEGDAFNHTMIVLDKVTDQTMNFNDDRKLEIRFAALVHDLGKGTTPKEEYPHHIGHEKRGAELVKNMESRLKLPGRLIKCGKTACLEHMRGGMFDNMTAAKKVSFIEKNYSSILGLDGLQIIVNADNTSEDKSGNQFEKIGYEVMNSINGTEIMKRYKLSEGKEIKNRMHEYRVEFLKSKGF